MRPVGIFLILELLKTRVCGKYWTVRPEYQGYQRNCAKKDTKTLWRHTYIQEKKQPADDT